MAKHKNLSREELLDAAQRLLLERGYDGFSFRDLAAEVGITSASLHHHFPTKGDLATAVVQRHRHDWNSRLAALAAETEDWPRRWRRILRAFSNPEDSGCLMSLLAACAMSLPPMARNEAHLLHSNLLGWFSRFIVEARKRDELPQEVEVEALASSLLALLQGGLLLARLGGNMEAVLNQAEAWALAKR